MKSAWLVWFVPVWLGCAGPPSSTETRRVRCEDAALWTSQRTTRDLDEAIAACRNVIDASIQPQQTATAYLHLGIGLQKRGKHSESIQPLRQAIALNPEAEYGHYYLAVALATEARALELQDVGSDAARLKEVSDTYAAAAAQYREALRLDGRHAESWSGLSWVLSQLGRDEESLGACRRAVEAEPSNPQYLVSLAMALNRLGHFEESVKRYEELAQLAPEAFAQGPDAEILAASRRGKRWVGWDDKTSIVQ